MNLKAQEVESTGSQGSEFRADKRFTPTQLLTPEQLQEFTRMDDGRAALSIAQTLTITIVTIAVALNGWAWWIVVPAIVVMATQQHAMFVLAHDAAHYRLLSNRLANDIVGRMLASFAGLSMCSYRVIHRLHHNHLYGKQDPDTPLHGGYPRGRAYLLRKLIGDLCGMTAWKTYSYFFGAPALNIESGNAMRPLDDTSPALRLAAMKDRQVVIALQLALPALITALFGLEGLVRYVVLWVVPAVTVLQVLLRIRAISEHGAPRDTVSPLHAARTTQPGVFARFLLFPHHVNYHIEHHLLPAVPHYHLPRLHALLTANGVLRDAEVCTFRQAWQRFFAPARFSIK